MGVESSSEVGCSKLWGVSVCRPCTSVMAEGRAVCAWNVVPARHGHHALQQLPLFWHWSIAAPHGFQSGSHCFSKTRHMWFSSWSQCFLNLVPHQLNSWSIMTLPSAIRNSDNSWVNGASDSNHIAPTNCLEMVS